jgi:hypothetical protein
MQYHSCQDSFKAKKTIEKVKVSNPLAKHTVDAFTKTSNKPQPVVPEVAPMAPTETIAELLMTDGGAMRRKRVVLKELCHVDVLVGIANNFLSCDNI